MGTSDFRLKCRRLDSPQRILIDIAWGEFVCSHLVVGVVTDNLQLARSKLRSSVSSPYHQCLRQQQLLTPNVPLAESEGKDHGQRSLSNRVSPYHDEGGREQGRDDGSEHQKKPVRDICETQRILRGARGLLTNDSPGPVGLQSQPATEQFHDATDSLSDTQCHPFEQDWVSWDEHAQMKEVVEQITDAAHSNKVGVEWSQAIIEVNTRHSVTV